MPRVLCRCAERQAALSRSNGRDVDFARDRLADPAWPGGLAAARLATAVRRRLSGRGPKLDGAFGIAAAGLSLRTTRSPLVAVSIASGSTMAKPLKIDAHVHVFTTGMPLIDNPRHAPAYSFTYDELIATMDHNG